MAYDIAELKDMKELFGKKGGRSDIFNSAVLLTIGAVISLLTTFVTTTLNNGKRFYRTSNLIKYYTPSGDTLSTNRYVKEYEETLYEWNSNKYVNISLIKLYFGEQASNEYINKVFNPLTDIGSAIITAKEPFTVDDRKALRDSLLGTDAEFQRLMYNLLEKTNK